VDAITAANSADQSETSVTYCTSPSSKLGSMENKDFDTISHAYGYLLPYTLYEQDDQFDKLLLKAVSDGGFSNSKLEKTKIDTAGRCLLPVYKADLAENNCSSGECAVKLSIAAGYRLYTYNQRKGGGAAEDKISIEGARESALEPTIQSALSKYTLNLLKRSVTKVRFQ
jgi:hypothetical protein